MKLLLGLGMLAVLLSGCTSQCRAPASMPPRVMSRMGDGVLVITAVYGSGTRFADVTNRVDELLHQPGVKFFARPEWLNADPTPGWNKALVIVYEIDGHRHIFTTGEGGKVSLQLLMGKKTKRHH